MSVWIEQRFLTGRFHATRWRQNPFEDRYGEWPPSPWRLLRALAGRWFQYARETGDDDAGKRRRLLASLASSAPRYLLPRDAWRGPALKQYQPVAVGWSDPAKKAAAVKQTGTTLAADPYWCLPRDHSVVWCWPDLELRADELRLLSELVRRVLYFGRAESSCCLAVLESAPAESDGSCELAAVDPGGSVPVLVATPGVPFNEEALLSLTDGPLLRNAPVPPGTQWYFARLPGRLRRAPARPARCLQPARWLQFAVGGTVYPQFRHWVRLTERVRATAIKRFCAGLNRDNPDAERRLAALAGKDSSGNPLPGHAHPYFALWPDENGLPTRLIVWRARDFDAEEMRALWAAAEGELGWGAEGWQVRLVPLPGETPLPPGFAGPARVWENATPFVPPAQRFRFRKNGKERPGEAPERLLRKLVEAVGLPECEVSAVPDAPSEWVCLHQTRERRALVERTRTPFVRPGFYLRIRFAEPVTGPICLGDSCHFGMGLFRHGEA